MRKIEKGDRLVSFILSAVSFLLYFKQELSSPLKRAVQKWHIFKFMDT